MNKTAAFTKEKGVTEKMKDNVKKMVTLALLSALAYVVMVLIKFPLFPAAPFLKYEPKDIIITIGGFMFGPLAAFLMSLVVSLVEMVTVSDTGVIGAVMNLISTCAFACTASFIYRKIRHWKGALIGLVAGTVVMIVVMLLWNYFLTPLYMATDKESIEATRLMVKGMLLPVFLPFNAIKGGINALVTLLIYQPVVLALRKAQLAPEELDKLAER